MLYIPHNPQMCDPPSIVIWAITVQLCTNTYSSLNLLQSVIVVTVFLRDSCSFEFPILRSLPPQVLRFLFYVLPSSAWSTTKDSVTVFTLLEQSQQGLGLHKCSRFRGVRLVCVFYFIFFLQKYVSSTKVNESLVIRESRRQGWV